MAYGSTEFEKALATSSRDLEVVGTSFVGHVFLSSLPFSFSSSSSFFNYVRDPHNSFILV